MGANGRLTFFGGVVDNRINLLPDQAFLELGFYNQAVAEYSDIQYAVQTGINNFYWADFDAMTQFCKNNKLMRTWYGGYGASVTNQWIAGFGWTSAQIKQAMINWLSGVAARNI